MMGALVILLGVMLSMVPVTEAVADCDRDWDRCFEESNRQDDACWNNCESRYSRDFDAWDRCTAACLATNERRWDQCDQALEQCERGYQGDLKDRQLYGNRRSGEDGCYFGECPGDIPPPTQDRPAPSPSPTLPSPPNQPQINMSSICQTSAFWCQMFAPGIVGYSCYCNSYYGPVWGVVVPQHY